MGTYFYMCWGNKRWYDDKMCLSNLTVLINIERLHDDCFKSRYGFRETIEFFVMLFIAIGTWIYQCHLSLA